MNNSGSGVGSNPFGESPPESNVPRWSARPWLSAIVALLFFGSAAFLYTRNNSFSYIYHPDEPSKVNQVVEGKRNFRHPLLLLDASAIAFRASALAPTKQNAALAGRFCSAIFAATTVTALALLARQQRGLIAMIPAGVLVMLYAQLFELAHFMKEDTALLMGLALFFLALNAFWKSRDRRGALLLGMAAGITASAKYAGIFAILIALPFVICANRSSDGRKGLARAFSLGAALAILTINLQGWLAPRQWARGLSRELGLFHRVEGGGYAAPSLSRLLEFAHLLPLGVWLFAAAYLAFLIADWKKRSAAEKVTGLFPFVFAAGVLIAGKESDRYFLPAGATVAYLSALGMVDLSSRLARKISARPALPFFVLIAVCLLAVVPVEARDLSATIAGLRAAHHEKLIDYVSQSVTADALIVAERRTGLVAPDTDSAAPIPQKVIGVEFASDLGTLAQLRAHGVTHVAVVEDNLVRANVLPATAAKKWGLYRELAAEGKLVFALKRNKIRFINPGLQLYQIAP